MRSVLTLDRVPLFAMAALLVVGWIGAEYYVATAPRLAADPFTQVWASYTRDGSLKFILFCLLGVVIAAVVPLGKGLTVASLTERARPLLAPLFPLFLLIGFGGLGLLIAVKGSYLLSAPAYLTFIAPLSLVSLANVVAPAALVAAGIVSVRWPKLGVVLLIAMSVVLFAYATRMFAGCLAAFVIGRLIAGARVRWWVWLLASLAAFLLLPFPLENRNLPTHGLIPYASHIPTFIFAGDFLNSAALNVAQNIGFSVPLMQFVADRADFPFSYVVVQLNPAPSGVAGWDKLLLLMRVHEYIPFSMLGEFARFGGLALAGAVAAFLGLMRWCILRVSNPENRYMPLLVTVALGLSLIAVLYAQQYNTRSVMRVLSLMFIVVASETAIRQLWPLDRSG